MRFALFDLDHTLLPFDTQTLFCNFVLKRQPWRVFLHALFIPYALGRAMGLCSTETAKRAFLSYLWGMKRSRLKELAKEFAHDSVRTWSYPELRAEILRHHHQGRKLVMNTASPDFYAHAIAEVFHFDYCVATRFEVPAKMPLMPNIIGTNNKREAKIAAMKEKVPGINELTDEQRFHCWAYSDSAADIPLLEFCGNRILVHPSGALQKHFPHHDVTILHPDRPYAGGKVGDMFSSLLQILGLHRVAGPNG